MSRTMDGAKTIGDAPLPCRVTDAYHYYLLKQHLLDTWCQPVSRSVEAKSVSFCTCVYTATCQLTCLVTSVSWCRFCSCNKAHHYDCALISLSSCSQSRSRSSASSSLVCT